jgi:hypothetical protein
VRGRPLALLVVAAAARLAAAAAPTVDYLYPAGGRQGATVAVYASGKLERWPVQFWADHPGIKADVAAEKGKLSIQIDKAVPPGPHLVRLYDAQGPSVPRVFVVGTQSESLEAEPNDEVSKAQAVDALPVVINGRLEKSGDVDSYAVKLDAGQCLCAAVQGRRLGSPMDPLLHLYDVAGNQLAFVHDGYGLDPLLVYRAEKAGACVVRVAGFKHPPAADVKLTGEAGDVYRLSLSTAPVVRYAMPAGVKRGSKATVRLFGWDGGELGSREVDATGATTGLSIPTDAGDGTFDIEPGDGPELTESEVTSPATAPCAVTGRLQRPGEEDAFRFAAKKDERVAVEVSSAAVASPLDAVLRIEDESGKSLATNDDERGQAGDAKLDWAAPADGVYRAVVSDLFGKGGDEYVYRLALRTPTPGVVATADADEYRVAPGKSVPVKLNVSRTGGYAAGLVAVVTGLPPGVTATAAEVPEKGGDVTVTVNAAADAKPAAGPIRVVLLGTDPARPVAWVASCSLKKEAGQEMIARTDVLWLTVPAP